jgi:peptide chain release factor subunit 1
MHAERFRALLTAEGPFASVYFDDSHDTEDAAAQLELKWRGLREQLEEQGGDELADRLEAAVRESRPPVGRSGRGLVVNAAGVLLDEHLIGPPAASIARVSGLPYIVPILEHGVEHHAYLVVAVDHAGADITVRTTDRPRAETVDGGGYPVHHASGAETSGYGDPQRTAENARAQNIRAVTERVTSLVDTTKAELVFVLGEVSSLSDLVADLPERVAERVVELKVGARHSGVDDDEVRGAIDTEFNMRRLAVLDDAAQRFQAESGRNSGLAAEGLAAVCAALREGAAETLIIGDLGDAVVLAGDELATIAPNENVLSELGVAPTRTLRADEALPLAAVAIDANLVRTDERISPAEGVAAVLRYARTQH